MFTQIMVINRHVLLNKLIMKQLDAFYHEIYCGHDER